MSGPIHVAMVLDSLQVGGVSRVVTDLCRGLDAERFRLTVVSLGEETEALDHDPLPEGVELVVAPVSPPERWSARSYLADAFLPGRAARRFPAAVDALRRIRPDILHLHTIPRFLTLGPEVRRWTGTELVFTDHVVRLRPSDYSPLRRLALRLALRRLYRPYHVVAVGPGVEAFHRTQDLVSPRRRHLLVENQVDLQRFHPPEEPRSARGPVEIVCVARPYPEKGHAILVPAFLSMETEQDCVLTLVGPTALPETPAGIPTQATRPHRRIRLLGFRSDVPDLIRRAHVGVLPSLREGLPLALMEYMASGLPVVATDLEELRSLVTHGETGLLVPPGDPAALAAALDRLTGSPELRSAMGARARAAMEARRQNPAVAMARLYEEILR